MAIWELFTIAVGLAMDAFSVAICKGLSVQKATVKHSVIAGLYFGGFQALMPLIGYLLGSTFERFITSIDHWIIFILLALIGINMIRESRKQEEEVNASFGVKAMLPLAIATSIDALGVGITFAFMEINIWLAIALIGIVTFILSFVGVKAGSFLGAKYKSRAELVGGIVLILIGLKILLEHLGVISW